MPKRNEPGAVNNSQHGKMTDQTVETGEQENKQLFVFDTGTTDVDPH